MQRRQGFTLTELLVSMALIVFIMTILSEAFATALESFRQMKASGEMQEKLRSVANVLRRDLRANHFLPDPRPNLKRLSDLDLSPTGIAAGQTPPDPTNGGGGFFRIWQRRAPTAILGADGFNTYTVTDLSVVPVTDQAFQALHFTINLRNVGTRTGITRPESYLSSSVPAGSPLLTLATGN